MRYVVKITAFDKNHGFCDFRDFLLSLLPSHERFFKWRVLRRISKTKNLPCSLCILQCMSRNRYRTDVTWSLFCASLAYIAQSKQYCAVPDGLVDRRPEPEDPGIAAHCHVELCTSARRMAILYSIRCGTHSR